MRGRNVSSPFQGRRQGRGSMGRQSMAGLPPRVEARGYAPAPPSEAQKPNEDSMRDQVFISYCHKDEKLMKELLQHLKPFSRSGAITAWSDQQIASGSQ